MIPQMRHYVLRQELLLSVPFFVSLVPAARSEVHLESELIGAIALSQQLQALPVDLCNFISLGFCLDLLAGTGRYKPQWFLP